MKKLLLMRHAKSSWNDQSLSDHERPLNSRGRKASKRMGKLLTDKDIVPGAIYCSTAERAKETSKILLENIPFNDEIIYLDGLYHAGDEYILETLQHTPDEINSVMVIGHNPDMEYFLEISSGERECLPTAAIAEIEFDISRWHELTQEVEGRLINIWLPRD